MSGNSDNQNSLTERESLHELDTTRRIRSSLPDRETIMNAVVTIDGLGVDLVKLEEDRTYHVGRVAVARNNLRDRETDLNTTEQEIDQTVEQRENEIDDLISEMELASDDDFISSMIEALKQRGCDKDHPNMMELYLLHIGAKVIERRALEDFKAILSLDTKQSIPDNLKLLRRQIELLQFMKVGEEDRAPGIGQPYLFLDTTTEEQPHVSSGLVKAFMLIGSKISLSRVTNAHEAKTADHTDENLYKSIALFAHNDTELGPGQEFTLTTDEICVSQTDVVNLCVELSKNLSGSGASIIAGQANIQHLLDGLEEIYNRTESEQLKTGVDQLMTRVALSLRNAGYRIVLDQDLADRNAIPNGQFVLPVKKPNSHVERVLNREIKKCAQYMYAELVTTDHFIVLQSDGSPKTLNRLVPIPPSGKFRKKSKGHTSHPTSILELLEESLDAQLESGFADVYLAQPATNTDYRNIALSLLRSQLSSTLRNPELEDRRFDKAALNQIQWIIDLIDQSTGLSKSTELSNVAEAMADQIQANTETTYSTAETPQENDIITDQDSFD